ncbi:tautomerase family protein [Campylobacter geochelonis]|uniref:4-oxalocrotonate tautomerase n=1 Tax=Campylobacter geochelonis TaxID=1780362 RepID=A0A128EPF1_9BACT|nr:4-oxalocrotonate tautomerase family protein [Campylobacter geochelonis]QKF70581.1 4-oxalocrotonate tautomerase family enzyme [Campylobacter geochelonis]CZE45989.1 4-oxalocrotonate tautomerase [Campylobacter geochelonis]CZE50375.1 4-oxalocrotonate tautomerase [Campylobacter geochelonis]
MPFINIKLTSPMPDTKLQDKIAKEITDIMVKNLGKVPQRTVVCFEEVPAEGFYFGGESVAEIRKKG